MKTDEQLEKQISEEFEKWAKTEGEKLRISEGKKYIHPWCEMGAYQFRPENWIRLKIGWQAAALPLMKKIEEQKRIMQSEALLNTSLSRANIELQKENHWLLVSYKGQAQMTCDIEKLQKENEELREALNFTTSPSSTEGLSVTEWIEKHDELRKKFNLDKEGVK